MKTLIIILILSSGLQAQQKWTKYIPMFAGSIVKGGLDASLEGSHFWPNQTAKLYGTTQEKFAPEYTWQNKWKNGDPSQGERFFLSSSLLVSWTDPYHKLRLANNVVSIYLPTLYPRKQTNLDRYLIIPAIQFVGQSIGFTLTEWAIKAQR